MSSSAGDFQPRVCRCRPYGRLLSRTDWGLDATWLTFKCSLMSINHQIGDCNQFELYRKGEWLTKERSGYAEDMILMTSDCHNTLALQNDKPANPNWFDTETIARGGQWTQGAAAGDPTTMFSTGDAIPFRCDQANPSPAVLAFTAGRGTACRDLRLPRPYVFAQGDGTNLYNRPPDAMTIRHASRSLVWLQPDTLGVEDPTNPRDVRFLHVLRADGAGAVTAGRSAGGADVVADGAGVVRF